MLLPFISGMEFFREYISQLKRKYEFRELQSEVVIRIDGRKKQEQTNKEERIRKHIRNKQTNMSKGFPAISSLTFSVPFSNPEY